MVLDQGGPVMVASYLEDFRRALRQMGYDDHGRKRAISALSVQSSDGSDLNTLNTLSTLHSYLEILERRCPPYIERDRWQQCLSDGRRFVADWGNQATALGWTVNNLFGLDVPPEVPHPSYSRLARLDCTGLVWLLRGAQITALSSNVAALDTGLKYRRAP
jgi:hypothetical protein